MRSLRSINDKLHLLVSFFENHLSIQTVYLFGSFGTDYQTELSDIDFAILFSIDIDLMEEMRINSEISSILGVQKIDMINLNKAPVHFQHEIISTGDIVYQKNRLKTQMFIEKVLNIYHDYGIILHKFNRDFEEGLKEEYLDA